MRMYVKKVINILNRNYNQGLSLIRGAFLFLVVDRGGIWGLEPWTGRFDTYPLDICYRRLTGIGRKTFNLVNAGSSPVDSTKYYLERF